MIVGGEPPNHAIVELLRNYTNRTTVTCARNFPERYISRVLAANPLRLLKGDVAICQSVDQEDRRPAPNNRVFR